MGTGDFRIGKFKERRDKNVKENKGLLTFSAFLAASAPDRLSKVTNPTGWKVKNKHKQFELISIKQNCC